MSSGANNLTGPNSFPPGSQSSNPWDPSKKIDSVATTITDALPAPILQQTQGMRKTQVAALAILCASLTGIIVGVLIVYFPVASVIFFIGLGALGVGSIGVLIYDFIKHRRDPKVIVPATAVKELPQH